ncbi:MAG: metal ABC transporter permease [Planctomycetota bacterium]|nr:metal ABC transporter permease [Planctomycetota bacterium]
MFGLDHNTQVVAGASALLGTASGLAGALLLLRKRALVGDALGHATLPGIAVGYLVSLALGGSGKEPWVLMLGAASGALLGIAAISVIRRVARVSEDTAMAIVLGTFFGFGAMLLTVIQGSPEGNQAGLSHFVTGHAASMVTADLHLAIGIAVVCIALILLFAKELRLLCFDEPFARSLGRSTKWLDALVLLVVTGVVVAGLQAVGLILVLALLVIPAAAARFVSDRFVPMLVASALIGAVSGSSGALISSIAPDLPTGPCIVVCAAALFIASLVLAPRNGLIARAVGGRL